MRVDSIQNPVKFIMGDDKRADRVEKFSFASFLSRAINEVDNAERITQSIDKNLAAGNIDNLHDAMIAAQKAEITLSLALEVKNQVLEAYREIMRIQV